MSKSNRLRLRDVREVFRLLCECRDLAGDPWAWSRHMFDGLCRMTGARIGIGGESRVLPSGAIEPVTPNAVGFDARELALFLEFMSIDGPNRHPLTGLMPNSVDRPVTLSRRQLMSDRDWYSTEWFNQFERICRMGGGANSHYTRSADNANTIISLHTTLGERDFTPRQRRTLHLFHAELGRLIGPVLVSACERNPLLTLAPRLRETLECLLEGDSEKQVAARLELSVPTVHQYVTELYRRFGVHSRPELLAYFLRRARRR